MLVFVIFVSACSQSTEPNRDETPPDLDFFLGIYPVENPFCPPAASYYINPRASSDNISADDDLIVRWDYESDGIWDTGFQEVDSILDYLPHPIPAAAWVVTGELKDAAGNSTIETVTLQLPTWMPRAPDIVAGEVRVTTRENNFTSVDTLQAGEEFTISLGRRDWVNEPQADVTQKYYIDGVFITEGTGPTRYPSPNSCSFGGYRISGGLQELGPHEIHIEAELNQGIIETNLNNNSATRTVFVVN